MKKKVLGVATAFLFAAGILLSLSENSHGHVSFIENSHAEVSPYLYRGYDATCPDGTTHIFVCGQGTDTCIPFGECPGM